MVRILVFYILFISTLHLHAQEEAPDTVRQIVTLEAKDALYYQRQAKRAKNPNTALALLNEALSVRSPAQDENWVADIHVEMSSALFKTGQTKRAFSELLTAEKIYTATGNTAAKADVMMHMARFYEKFAVWGEATKYYQAAKNIYQFNKDTGGIANASLHLADIALIQNDLSKAGTSIGHAIKQYQAQNNKTGVALSYVKLAEIYRRKKQYTKGEKVIINSALPLFRSTGYRAGRIGCFDVLGKIYLSQKRYSEAKWFFIQANTQSRELNDVEGVIISLTNLAKVKIAIRDYNLAKRDLKEAQALASKRGNLFLLANVKEEYASLYKSTGNLEGSEIAGEHSANLKDSLDSYFDAQAESARTARVKPAKPDRKKKPSVSLKKDNSWFIIKMVGGALVILFVILLILRRVK